MYGLEKRRNILVTGGTGRQGSALIRALLLNQPAEDDYDYHVYALTRGKPAPLPDGWFKELMRDGRLSLMTGDLDDKNSIQEVFKVVKSIAGGFWGVFVVLPFPGLGVSGAKEERQGKLLADLAWEWDVKAFVYSSAMTPGPNYEDQLRFSGIAKLNVEKYIKEMGEEKEFPWVILKPGFFMENFEGVKGSVAVSVFKKGLKPDTTISLVSTEDIGGVAAAVFRNHESYNHRELVLAAEFVTLKQIEESHQRATGKPIFAVPNLIGWALSRFSPDTKNIVIRGLELNHEARTLGKYPTYEEELELARGAFKMRSYYEWRCQKSAEEKTQVARSEK